MQPVASAAEIAVQKGWLTRDQLDEALLMHTVAARRRPQVTLLQVLVQHGALTEAQACEAEARHRRQLEERAHAAVPEEVRAALARPDARHGKFVRVALLGRGGMGEVHRAWDLVLGRWVAVKSLSSMDEERWQAFRREADVLARLHHPNIVPLHEVGDRFIVMPRIDGPTLDRAGLALAERVRAVRQAALAVQHAHEQGVIHRDLKPANLLVERAGPEGVHAWVTDFGIARDVRHDVGSPDATAGTPEYMAPERRNDPAHPADARSDVYGLGATLFHVATGAPPIVNAGGEAPGHAAVGDDAPPPRGIPADLAAVIRKAMARDPLARYPTAADLATELGRWLAGEPVAARPGAALRRVWRGLGRRLPALVAAIVLIALGSALLGPGGPAAARERGLALRERVLAVQEGILRWRMEGRNPEPVGRLMAGFDPLMRAGRIDEAEATLAQAIALLATPAPSPTPTLEPKMQRLQQGLQPWLRKGKEPTLVVQTMRAFEPLLLQGRAAEAAAILDRALALLPLETKRLQMEERLPAYAARGGSPARLEPLMRRLQSALDRQDLAEGERALDAILLLLAGQEETGGR